MKKFYFLPILLIAIVAIAQHKIPLNHSVYDNWKSIGERLISNDGQYVVYTVNPQEGDGELVVQNATSYYKKTISRGYNAQITEDSRFLVFKIKPYYQDTRQARIKKKKADEMPKDSLAIIELGKEELMKLPRIKGFKIPEKGFGWLAYQSEKILPDTAKKSRTSVYDSAKIKIELLVKLSDSIIRKSIDSIKGRILKEDLITALQKTSKEILKKGAADLYENVVQGKDADGDDQAGGETAEGTDLSVKSLKDGITKTFKLVSKYYFDKNGKKLVIETTRNSKDSNSKAYLLIDDLLANKVDTIMKGFNDCRNYAFDEEGSQLAFVAERDSSLKSLQKFYKLWYYYPGADSARLIADKNTVGMHLGFSVSENAGIKFSRNGKKLFFGVAPVRPPKDTSLVDFELARLDLWHYKDDYLQPQQLKQLDNELKRSYVAVISPGNEKLVQLGGDDAEKITLVDEGNADWVLSESTKGNRVESQWTGRTRTTAYVISTADGNRKLIKANSLANFEASPAGKYVYWYDPAAKNYFTYEVASGMEKNISAKVKQPLYEEENDVPDNANPYGVMGWQEGDSAFYVYDRYDAWNLDPNANFLPENITGIGREGKQRIRYLQTDPDRRFLQYGQPVIFRAFNETEKSSSILTAAFDKIIKFQALDRGNFIFNAIVKAKKDSAIIYTRENYISSQNMIYNRGLLNNVSRPLLLSDINPQQVDYNWGSAELFKWKAYNGKQAEGIVYKPEDYDPKKKYPMICYFYEKLSDGLNSYIPPAPTASRLNISFYVSRGYIVFAPDISYSTGRPGMDAFDYVVSGARALVNKGLVDSTRIGIQGQSWGGYQVAYLITATKLFAAAWAGAPVANMTSAYGGIRWESGVNRQFQYEKSQSRLGASLWEKPALYIENSPLFRLPKVATPLVVMSNDADGAVPWYQGIELFTGLRRLGKPVWLLQYNGEAHNLVERKNRKDIQIREQQFFDWKLKGEKPARWLTDGVPATNKGIDWGLKTE